MVFLKNKLLKKIFLSIFVLISMMLFGLTISATTNLYIEIINVSANATKNTVTFEINTNINTKINKYGILISNIDNEITIDNNNLVKYEIKNDLEKTTLITISIPKEYNYHNMYVKAFVETEENIIYSNKIKYIYAELTGLNKIVIKNITYQNDSLILTTTTSLNNNAEYGLIFSKNQSITDLNLENAENDHFETEIIKLEALNENNEFRVTIKDIPVYELNVKFKACAYVKNKQTNEVYYSDTYEINILELYYNEIINNIEISYNSNYDGIRFKTTTIIPNNRNYAIGFVFLNNKTDELDVHTPNAYIIEVKEEESFAVTMNNIPTSAQDTDIYAVSFIRFLNENNEYEYYYSDVYFSSYNKIKETYLINNS